MREPVAIVGMGAVFPGAPDLDAYWSNIERGLDAITGVPPARLDPVYFAGSSGFACTRGGFVDAVFDPIAFGIMPIAAASAEPDQLLALHVAAAALDDAGVTVPRERTAVILGRGGYLTPGMARLSNRVRTAQQLVTTLAELLPDLTTPRTVEDEFAARSRIVRASSAPQENDRRAQESIEAPGKSIDAREAIGLKVPNLAASRIANRLLDLRGPAYTDRRGLCRARSSRSIRHAAKLAESQMRHGRRRRRRSRLSRRHVLERVPRSSARSARARRSVRSIVAPTAS